MCFLALVLGQADPFHTASELLAKGQVEEARKLLVDLLSQNPGAEPIEALAEVRRLNKEMPELGTARYMAQKLRQHKGSSA